MNNVMLPGTGVTPEALTAVPEAVRERLLTYRTALTQLTNRLMSVKQSAQLMLDEMTQRVKECEAALSTLQLPAVQAEQLIRFRETFGSLDMVDTASTTAAIDPVLGMMTLPAVEYVDVTEKVDRIVVNPHNSVGIPGNNMVVSSMNVVTSGGKEEPSVRLDGDPDNHAHEVCLIDGRPDTWLEWERNIVKDRQPLTLRGTAYIRGGSGASEEDVWTVTNGLDWTVRVAYPGDEREVGELPSLPLADLLPAPDNRPARIDITISLLEPARGAWLTVDMLSIGRVPVHIERIDVSPDGSNWLKLAQDVFMSEAAPSRRFFLGYQSSVKFIRLVAQAAGFYRPRIGLAHLYQVLHIRETRRTRLLGIQIGKKVKRYARRVSVGERVVGSLVYRDSTNGTLRLMGAFLGATLAQAGTFTGVLKQMLKETAIGKGIMWVAKQLGGASTTVAAVANVVSFALMPILGSLLFRETVEVEVESAQIHADVLDGWRSALGIREIQISRSRHVPEAVYVSQPIRLSVPVRTVQLVVDEVLPEGTSVEYAVRSEHGEWMPIRPYRRAGTAGSVYFDTPVQTLILRATLRTQRQEVTPVIYGLALEGI